MKRWYPFILIVGLVIFFSLQLFWGGQADYTPVTADPSIIYIEACLECHGDGQQPANIWSPDLSNEILLESEVRQIVHAGNWRMPAFPMIPDSILDSLTDYVVNKRFVVISDKETKL
jgi:mono/diheme cytochrome c family protein